MPVPVRVVSVERSLFEGEADFVLCRGAEGDLGILPRHSPLLTTLRPGPVRIDSGAASELLFVGGGFLEVLPDRITILADEAERAEDIDEGHAEEARRRAEERLQHVETADDRVRLQEELETAEERLRLAREMRGRRGGG
ncbi:MAG: F0F1 ATP synthase subunit epsilon [Candidatus Dormibacteraceae bacterium]